MAYRLSQEGAKVYLIDRTGPASGTTSASFAWINANNKTPREYFELNHAGMKEHFRLHNELSGGTSWLHQGGNLIQVEKEAFKELEDRVERLRLSGLRYRMVHRFSGEDRIGTMPGSPKL